MIENKIMENYLVFSLTDSIKRLYTVYAGIAIALDRWRVDTGAVSGHFLPAVVCVEGTSTHPSVQLSALQPPG